MDYSDIKGHQKITANLKASVKEDRVSHAYIFDGANGIGKNMIARAFAKSILCENGGEEPCGKCFACRSIDGGNNPDVIFVTHEKKAISVEDIRKQVVEQALIKPFSCKKKIFIIDEADLMNIQAQNALLKTLEEPPDYVVFMLLSENLNKFLVTILSRCITFRLNPLPSDIVKNYLIENEGADPSVADYCCAFAGGSIGKAVELLNSQSFRDVRDFTTELIPRLDKADMTQMYKLISELDTYKESINTVLEIMLLTYRDALVLLSGGDRFVMQRDKVGAIEEMTKKGAARLIKSCAVVENAMADLRGNADYQLTMEKMFFDLKM